jgi:membrane protease YdiL (CAAX protease family)
MNPLKVIDQNQEHLEGWKHLYHLFFSSIEESQFSNWEKNYLISCFKEVHYESDSLIVQRKAQNFSLFYIAKGTCAVLTNDEKGILSILGEGEIFGEVSALFSLSVTASIKSQSLCRLKILDLKDIFKDQEKSFQAMTYQDRQNLSDLKIKLMQIASKGLTGKLISSNEKITDNLKKQIQDLERKKEDSLFLSRIFIGLTLYVLCLDALKHFSTVAQSDSFVSIGVIVFFSFLCGWTVKQSTRPLADFGLHLKNWRKNLAIGLLGSLPWLFLGSFVKAILVWQSQGKLAFFNPTAIFENPLEFSWSKWALLAVSYCGLTFFQELIGRGAIQSALSYFFFHGDSGDEARFAVIKAIVISNLMFAATHMHLGWKFALISFIPGLYWGYLFYRTSSLITPTISHLIIGLYFVFCLNF